MNNFQIFTLIITIIFFFSLKYGVSLHDKKQYKKLKDIENDIPNISSLDDLLEAEEKLDQIRHQSYYDHHIKNEVIRLKVMIWKMKFDI